MITVETLQQLTACEAGLQWFKMRYPAGLDPAAWTYDEQVAALCAGGGPWLMWGVRHHLIPWWGMVRADLSGAGLSGANLRGAIVCNHTVAPDQFAWPETVTRIED